MLVGVCDKHGDGTLLLVFSIVTMEALVLVIVVGVCWLVVIVLLSWSYWWY